MRYVRVAAAVLNQTPLDWDGNRERIVAAVREAREQDVSILCLPEMCVPGYGCEDAFHSPSTEEMSWEVLGEILPETRGMVVSLGLPVSCHGALYNAVCLVVDGKVSGLVAKKNLAGDGIHYEPRWFKPWPEGVFESVSRSGVEIPAGDLVFDVGGVRIGFEICEDAWVADRPGGALSARGVQVILNPSASHFSFGKLEVRKRFVVEGSRAFGVAYVYSNLLGNEAGRAIYDGGALIASEGRLVAEGPRFSYRESLVTSALVDVDWSRRMRAGTATFRTRFDRDPEGLVKVPYRFPEREPELARATPEAWSSSSRLKEEEFTRAETLALFDYLRKSRSQGFVVSISGGADSAAVSCLVALMVERAAAELGIEGLKARLAYVPGLAEAKDVRALVRRLLLVAYQSTANSGPVTRAAARDVAEAIGAEHHEFDVEALVQGYRGLVETALARPLDWTRDNVALQNIQARVRSPGIWMLANIRNALLLSTSNRSEAAVGYATMDGDTSGGLSPIAGIDKDFLRRWLRWLETEGPAGSGPIPALAAVNRQQPTAELRPPADRQTDEGDLMPYDLLDAIEGAAIRDKHGPIDVYRLMRVRYPGYTRPQLVEWVERFFNLWSRNQWKRERYAPSFHLDDKNLDPRSWCRFPILSGGFRRELARLRTYAEVHP